MENILNILQEVKRYEAPDSLKSKIMARVNNEIPQHTPIVWYRLAAVVMLFLLSSECIQLIHDYKSVTKRVLHGLTYNPTTSFYDQE